MKSLLFFDKKIEPQHLKLSIKGVVQKIKLKEKPLTNHSINESYQEDLKRK